MKQIYDFDNMVVFDLETTGCHPVNHEIIEIGAIKIKEGRIIDEYSQLINPEGSIPAFITDITGITDDMVMEAPVIQEVLPIFLDFCKDSCVLGHNISFDYRFIKAKCSKYNYLFEKKVLDTLTLARKYLKHLPSRSLGPICDYYQIDLVHAHRAIHDAKATYEVFMKLKEAYFDIAPDDFVAYPMNWEPPKQEGITPRQKSYLKHLLRIHHKVIEKDIESITKAEASRMIDELLREARRA